MNLKSKVRQFAPVGTAMSVLSTVTSRSLFPRTLLPRLLVFAKVPGFGTEFTLPLVRMPNVEPSVGKLASAPSDVPFGVPPVVDANDAPVISADGDARACEMASAPAGPVCDVTAAAAGTAV